MPSNLKHEAEIYLWLRERLLEQHESLKDDDVALADTLEGITHLHEAIEYTVQKIAEDEEMLCGMAERANALATRGKRIGDRVTRMRRLILETLQKTGQKRIDHPEFTISRSKGRLSVVVEDQQKLPDRFLKDQEKLPDKTKIKEALDQGIKVPGAKLSEPTENLVIRRG